MAQDSIDTLMQTLQKLDTKGEFASLYTDRNKWEEVLKQRREETQEVMVLLDGYGKLHPILDKVKEVIKEGREFTDEEYKQPLQYVAKISDEEMLEIYQVCYDLFNEKQFEKSAKIATWMGFLNPAVSAFWKMVGVSLWQLQDFQGALTPFICAAVMDESSVDNHIAVLQCLVKLGHNQEALNYYQLAKQFLTDAHKQDSIPKLDAVTKNL